MSVAIAVAAVGPVAAYPPPITPTGDAATYVKGTRPLTQDEETEQRLKELDLAFMTRRTAGDLQLSNEQAGEQRAAAAGQAGTIRSDKSSSGPATFNSPWMAIGPDPIVQVQRSNFDFAAQSGRIGALAIRKNGQFILGAAQGGIWTFNATTNKWTPRTDNLPSLAIGALAVAPSNDMIVYAGTGEGALSGDSYFGNGVLKSTDGGFTWKHVSGDYFAGVSISRLVVDPTNFRHLYVSVLRGRGGAKRVSPPDHSRFGIWESTNSGVTWTLRKEVPTTAGATDVRIDPQNHNILYASFWGDAIYKSTNGGATWATAMTGLPAVNYAATATRFSISISHPAGQPAVLYVGFDWADATAYHPARIWKSTNEGATWSILPAGTGLESVEDYCGSQCYYDNVVEADPNHSNVLFVAGQFGYGLDPASGGVFRSDDGGMTWRNLGWNMHPDFHALAFDPVNTAHVLIGNDGGVYFSTNRGGRPNASDAISAVDWQNLNGTVDPNTGAGPGTGLQISQFSSFATNPTRPARFWGGTQDNGTLRKFNASNAYYDVSSGDGGQVLVDPTDWHYVYGNYYGISPWRVTDGGGGIFTNQYITNGIAVSDRSDFYPPFTLNQNNPSQLFVGTYRVYRTDNSKTAKANDVTWHAISPDLTSGCKGTAPNGARNCTLSAIGVGGGTAVYSGSLDGYLYFSSDAQVSNNPTWTLLGSSGQDGQQDGDGNGDGNVKLPRRPIASIAVDRSNYRVAYVGYNGFNAATPQRPGHVFKTTDAGQGWADISGNLPDSPVNSVILDPTYPNTLYAGTDVGPFVTRNGGASWSALGTGFPIVAIWQLDLDPFHRVIGAGTHGRGAFKITDTSAPKPALVLSKVDSGIPVGPGSNIDYTLTVHNIGNANATGVKITDSIPENTTFVSADSGGTYSDGKVTWSGLSVPMSAPVYPAPMPTTNGGTISVHLTVRIASPLDPEVKSIVNDKFKVTSAEGPFAVGSPTVTPIAPPYSVTISPASQTDGAKPGQTVTYHVTLKNLGYNPDHYNMSVSGPGTFPVTFYDSTCTVAVTATPTVAPGATTSVCVKVAIPMNGSGTSTSIITATSAGSPTTSASATINTIAVTADTLLVDQDGNVPDVNAYYTAALTAAGTPYILWDLDALPNISQGFIQSFKHIVWFTGNTYPAPIKPYEAKLKAFLDGGGHLFISGQDLLDGPAGTSAFVSTYLHVTWDGSEAQNDKATIDVTAVAGSLTDGAGTVGLNTSVLGNAYMDQITPNGTAVPIFRDHAGKTDALSYSGTYKVVFLAFAMEEYGTAAQKADLVHRVMTFFGA